MINRNSWRADFQRQSLLQKIQAAGIPLRDIDDGRPFNHIQSALTEKIPPNRLIAIEPPTYGFGSVEAFFDFASPVLGPLDRWVVPILASPIMNFFWQETTRARQLAANSHEAFETLGELPIKIPHR
ncbi:MAG: hypothetical protein KC964_31150, partial [Candidatus Omnitrophica bacterium]|nr:hypothetical protein [Candidatus Omnitrophota bacterium]